MFVAMNISSQLFKPYLILSRYQSDKTIDYSITSIRFKQQGFTLLEMILVLFLVGLMATTTLMLTEGVEDQAKYDETKRRMQLIRKAIVGDPTRTINGSPEISGFASDMGRLPGCIRELLEARNCADDEDLVLWFQDPDSQVWSGWRGPYLQVMPERDGSLHFRDGYGNQGIDAVDDASDWGWIFIESSGEISLRSRGFDINDSADNINSNQLVRSSDYQVFLGSNWQTISVRFYKSTTTNISIAANSLRVRLNYPENGVLLGYGNQELDTAEERNLSPYLTETFPETDLSYPASADDIVKLEVKNTEKIDLNPAGVLTGNNLTVGAGTVVSYTDISSNTKDFTLGSSCDPDCIITVPNHGETDGSISTVLFTADGDLVFSKRYTNFNQQASLAKIIITVPATSSVVSDILTLPGGATVSLPTGSSGITNNQIILNGTTATVSEAFLINDTTVTTSISGDTFTVPPGTTNPSANDLFFPAGIITVPAGVRSLTVICEVDGSVFDGNCPGTEEREPVNLLLTPRGSLALDTSTIDWFIQ